MTSEYSTCVALLHDIIEDTDTTEEELLHEGFPKEVKYSDLKHNSDLSRLDIVTAKDLLRVEKYNKAIQLLEE